jgi:hypothetical protein
MVLFAESQIISAIHVVTKNNNQNRYTCAHNHDKIVPIDNHVRWCFYRLLIQIKHIMLGNEEASIRVWNKYIDNPNPKGVGKLLAEETQVSETSCFSVVPPLGVLLKNCVYRL